MPNSILPAISLRCPNRHTFDIAKQGYVNLAPAAKQSQFYSKESFANRGRILNAGYYSHIASAVLAAVRTHCPANPRPAVLDAGCGEGFYARAVQQANPQADVLAFDISKDSVQQAAREDTSLAVCWFVGNLADLPLRDAAVDCILDVFSPYTTASSAACCAPAALSSKWSPARGTTSSCASSQARTCAIPTIRTSRWSTSSPGISTFWTRASSHRPSPCRRMTCAPSRI